MTQTCTICIFQIKRKDFGTSNSYAPLRTVDCINLRLINESLGMELFGNWTSTWQFEGKRL